MVGTVQSTHTYGYATDSWKDRLTSYNGQTITYDSIGNPLTYNNGSAYTFTWEGRQMQTAILKLKGNPWDYPVWNSEYYDDGGWATNKTLYYNSKIYYIVYWR